MHYYQFNIGDYVKHTAHLSPLEDIAYRRLLDLYYDTETPIPNDIPWVSRRLRLGSEIIESVLKEFFDVGEKGWINLRADDEIKAFHAFNAKQKSNGIKGGRPKKTQNNPVVSQTKPKITLTTTHKPTTNTADQPDGFTAFWTVYPKKVSKPAAIRAFKAQRINGELSAIVDDVKRRASSDGWQKNGGQYIPHPSTYLNQRQWEDVIGQPGAIQFPGAI